MPCGNQVTVSDVWHIKRFYADEEARASVVHTTCSVLCAQEANTLLQYVGNPHYGLLRVAKDPLFDSTYTGITIQRCEGHFLPSAMVVRLEVTNSSYVSRLPA